MSKTVYIQEPDHADNLPINSRPTVLWHRKHTSLHWLVVFCTLVHVDMSLVILLSMNEYKCKYSLVILPQQQIKVSYRCQSMRKTAAH